MKTLRSSNYPRVKYFLLKFWTRFLLTNVYKRCSGLFLFCLDLELFAKLKMTWFLHAKEASFLNDSRSKRNKKNLEHPFVDVSKKEMCVKFQQKILNSMVVGARQSFQFFRQTIWFLENHRALSRIFYGILHYLISIIK